MVPGASGKRNLMTALQQPFDRERVPGTELSDLNLALVEEVMFAGERTGRYSRSHDPHAYLLRCGGVVSDGPTLHPTVAGVLAFTPEPDRWLTASGIDIAIHRSNQIQPTNTQIKQVRGTIFAIIDDAFAILKAECTIGRLEGARMVSELDIPEIVLRELTTNAVVHRDLNVPGSQVRIDVNPSYIEWVSPGGLPANITIETLLTAQFSRNPSLAQFLFHKGYIEKFGMGLDVVLDTLNRTHHRAPEFYDDNHSFRVRIYRNVDQAAAYMDMTTREQRIEAILALFAERHVWSQRDLLARLRTSRSTLQRDLDALVKQGQLLAQGATKTRIYSLPHENEGRRTNDEGRRTNE
jgi:ATP-dependent DNA helicase RecG